MVDCLASGHVARFPRKHDYKCCTGALSPAELDALSELTAAPKRAPLRDVRTWGEFAMGLQRLPRLCRDHSPLGFLD